MKPESNRNDRSSRFDRQRAPLTGAGALARLLVIGAVLVAVAGAFAYVGGWLSPNRLTQARMIAAFEAVNGDHPGFRRNHAKGICVTGWFESNGSAVPLSKAAVFAVGRIPLIGRFALAGGMPLQADTRATVRSMALRFLAPGGEEWRTGMNNIPVFAAFRFVNVDGAAVPVRWAMVPLEEALPESAAQSADADKNYLFDDLIARIRRQPLHWRLVITIGQPGDPTADATLPWPEDRRHVDAGLVSMDRIASEDNGSCTDVNYDPLALPSGIEPSDDPLLSARSAAYARSFTLRTGEQRRKPASAVSTQEVQAGGAR
jgi:catalase